MSKIDYYKYEALADADKSSNISTAVPDDS